MNTVISTHRGMDRLDRNHQSDEMSFQNARFNRHRDGAERIHALRRDMLDSAPSIEHYNNYSKNGLLVDGTISSQQPDEAELQTQKNESEKEQKKAEMVAAAMASGGYHPAEFTHILMIHRHRYPEVDRIREYVNQGLLDYAEGRISADEVAVLAEKMYKDLLELNIAMGKTDGNDSVFNEILLQNTHGNFISYTVDTLYKDMYSKGFKYARDAFGYSPNAAGDRFVYYDSTYYYACKELQAIGDATFSRIAKDEGLSGFQVSYVYDEADKSVHCFNTKWNELAGPGNAAMSGMKDVNLAPPVDFKMFFSPSRYSQEARDNGTYYVIEANDPLKHNGNTGWSFNIKVPKVAELWRSLPFWMTLTQVPNNYPKGNVPVAATYDISKYLTPGAGFNDSLQDFFAKYVNNFDNGVLTIWQGDTMTEYDVPFDTFFTNTRQLNGSQVVPAGSYNDFLSNFEFGLFLQR